MAAIAFALYCLPNYAASKNMSMIQMFEPDEAAPLPYLLHMIAPAKSIEAALRSFVFYEYYFYGFPYFGPSALVILPLKWLGRLGNLSLVMLVLRQMISVLPMLAGLLGLVYLQDGFRTYRSPLLFALLLSVPAIVHNGFWWHPDGIILLLVVLTIFFLRKDNLRLGWGFRLAAVWCGVAVAAKLIGVYFFLAVGLVLLLAILMKKVTWKRAVLMAMTFILVMAVSFVVANPFLLSHWARAGYINTVIKQSELLSEGYGVVYGKGLASAWPIMHRFFGEALFIIIALGAVIWGIIRDRDRLLHAIILAWFIPVTFSALWLTHFKYQYWLPAALPVFSSLLILLPEKVSFHWSGIKTNLIRLAALLVVVSQFGVFAYGAVYDYYSRLHRADNNQRIQFYDKAVATLQPLAGQSLHVYYDYRLYVPETPGWTVGSTADLLEYGFIQQNNYDVLLLLEQRIRDYLQPGMQGIDPALFALNQQFYRDADQGKITDYHLLYRDSIGLIYVRDNWLDRFSR